MQYLVVEIQNLSFCIPITDVAKLFPVDESIAEKLRSGNSLGHFHHNGTFWKIACLSQRIFGVPTQPKRGTRILVPSNEQGTVFLCETVLGLLDLPQIKGKVHVIEGRESTVISLQDYGCVQMSENHA